MTYSDETLSAFIDGELPEDDAAVIETEIAREPALKARIDRLRGADAALRVAYGDADKEPLPEHIVRMLSAEGAGGERKAGAEKVISFFSPRSLTRAWPTALAASLALVVGYVVAGVFTVAPSGSSVIAGVVPVGEKINPGHPLFATLETGVSAEPFATSETDVSIEPVLTFKSQNEAYCREFLVRSDSRGARGVACREDGAWVVRVAVAATFDANNPSSYRTASSADGRLIDEFVTEIKIGDALNAKSEETLIDNQWRE